MMKIEDTYHYGLDNRELDHDLCKCLKCGNTQYEKPHPLNKGGKYGWRCDRCRTSHDGDKIHLLSNIAIMRSSGELYW